MIPTEILRVVKGIPRLPGDENSAEIKPDIFALHLDNAQTKTGFSLNPNLPWQPARAVVKPQQWIDSNRKDGRTLDGNAVSNVRETINVTATAGTHLELVQRIARLQRMAEQAQLFHSSFYQIDPVYLEWSMKGGKGPQYALIYDIEIAITYNDAASGGASADIVLVIEREPAWRGIPPGANPKLWTYYWREVKPLPPSDDYKLIDNDLPALFTDTVTNANEFNFSVDAYAYPSRSQNYIDIPAEDIPGDAPALVMLNMNTTNIVVADEIHIGRSTKPKELPTRDGLVRRRIYALVGADANFNNIATVADSSAPRRGFDGTRLAARTGSTSGGLTWGQNATTTTLNANNMRGKYTAYVRCLVSGGSTITFTLEVMQAVTSRVLATIVGQPATANGWAFIGAIELPAFNNARSSYDGKGIENQAVGSEELFLRLSYEISGTTSDIYDLILVPFDEPNMVAILDDDSDAVWTYDNTGYLQHGAINHAFMTTAALGNPTPPEYYQAVRGEPITLLPNVDNSLVLWVGQNVGGNSGVLGSMDVELDIVPRWYGIRDA